MIILWGLWIYILSFYRRHHCTLCEMKIFHLKLSKSLENLVKSGVVILCNTMAYVIMCNLIYSFTVRLLNAAQDFEKLMRSVLVNIFKMQWICLECNYEWVIFNDWLSWSCLHRMHWICGNKLWIILPGRLVWTIM